MKTYVLTISRQFPKTHKQAGNPTRFIEGIFAVKVENSSIIDNIYDRYPHFDIFTYNTCFPKWHTIRGNYDLWKKRFEKIDAGEAELSLRYWEGKPYNSKQREFLKLSNLDGIGLQKLKSWSEDKSFVFITTPNGNVLPFDASRIAINDGLSRKNFDEWFKGYDLSKPMAIIHFTNFRYQEQCDIDIRQEIMYNLNQGKRACVERQTLLDYFEINHNHLNETAPEAMDKWFNFLELELDVKVDKEVMPDNRIFFRKNNP